MKPLKVGDVVQVVDGNVETNLDLYGLLAVVTKVDGNKITTVSRDMAYDYPASDYSQEWDAGQLAYIGRAAVEYENGEWVGDKLI